MTETAYYTRKNLITAFIIGFIIGLGSYYIWDTAPFQNKNTDVEQNEKILIKEEITPEDEIKNEIMETKNNSVSVNDQLAGLKVNIDFLNINKESWIAIRETNKDGSLANILGAVRYPAGTHNNVEIELSRNTVEDEQYYVVIYLDDGNKKEFDFREKDILLTDENGEVVKFGFKTLRTK